MDGLYWKGDRTMSTNEWLLTSDFWQFLEPWHGRWYENEIFIASCTDNIYDLENERWLLGDMIDHVGIYGSGVAEGLSAFSVGLVFSARLCTAFMPSICQDFCTVLCIVVFKIVLANFIYFLLNCLNGAVIILWSPQWSNPEEFE